MTTVDRRSFLRQSTVAGAGLVGAGAVQTLAARNALAKHSPEASPYGPVSPVRDRTTGERILALPRGFKYATFGAIGSTMSDGLLTPIALDGMACFPHPSERPGRGARNQSGRNRGLVRLIRNHEDRNAPGAGSNKPTDAEAGTVYDPQAGGGTSTLDFDTRKFELVQDFISLKGTIVNCAGGFSLGQTGWLTSEETVRPFGSVKHGYNFFVPVDRDLGEGVGSQPIVPMGRFAHEAACTDERTGIVYQTEDAGSGVGSGFYRFIPDSPRDFMGGGRLEMLAVVGSDRADLREGQTIGDALPVRWVPIASPDTDGQDNNTPGSVFQQGSVLGGAKFNRLEGCWYDDKRSIFFCSTSGGDVKNPDRNSDGFQEGYGQVWQYRTDRFGGTLTLVYESTGKEALDSPDNLLVTPRGGIILCEDDASGDDDTNPADPNTPKITDVNRLIGFSRRGGVFEFAVNILNDTEFAGATFSPDGRVLFVNIFGEGSSGTIEARKDTGMTIAITGPWNKGPL
ncbi:MAG: PhoX family protein [Actinomycetota bacterium]|nr:PhoX family protein [Actinomycetota bacterium]